MNRLFFWKNEKHRSDISEGAKRNKLKSFITRAVGMISRDTYQRNDFEEPAYNFEEIRIASEKDSYIREALLKQNNLIYKAGYKLKGEDEIVDYIKQRFRIMSFATDKPIDVVFQEIGEDLVKYSNAFLVKARVDPKDIPINKKINPVYGNKVVGGYFRINPCSMRIKRDDNGMVIKYQQEVDGKTKDFNPEDVIHLYTNREAGEAFGTPRIVAALEDVKLLRKIEGIVVNLIYRFAIPIYQWKVGIPEAGFQATDSEIDDAQREIEGMSLDGVIVTNERTKIEAIGVDNAALDASGYLEYFEKRVFTALNVSAAQMGRESSGDNADSMEAQMHGTIKFIQKTISIFLENFMLSELLLEGGYDPITTEDHIVEYNFNEISLDTKVKLENHEMLKFQSNVITHEEMRKNIGLKEVCDEDRLYNNMIVRDSILEQIKAKQDATSSSDTESESNGLGGNGKEVEPGPNKDVSTRNKPSNQHGTYSANIKEEVIFRESTKIINGSKAQNKSKYQNIYLIYELMVNDVIDSEGEDLDFALAVGKLGLVDEFNKSMYRSSQHGVSLGLSELKKKKVKASTPNVDLLEIKNSIERDINNFISDISKGLKNTKDPVEIRATFDSLEYRVRYMIEYHFRKAYWHGFLSTGRYNGVVEARIDFDGSEDAKEHNSIIKLNKYKIDDIPAFHSFCDCTVSFIS